METSKGLRSGMLRDSLITPGLVGWLSAPSEVEGDSPPGRRIRIVVVVLLCIAVQLV